MNSRIQALKIPHLVAALCALLLAADTARAVISPTINYQGYLISKVSNLPVETPQDLKFIIYPTATGITGALFSETVCDVRVTKGRYDVEVGSATGGIPAEIFSDNSGLWMEVQVDADGDCSGSFEAMTPRVRLQASPYAFSSVYATTSSVATSVFKANTIDALPYTDNGAVTISTNLFVMGGISVGSISPGQTLAVAGIVESSTGGFKFPDGSIQTRAAAFTMWDLVGSNLYTINPGDVSIGESNQNPLARLHISSATNSGGVDNLLMVSTVTGSTYSQLFLVNSNGEVYANHYYGDGTTLSGIVRSAGDNMTGPLTMAGSTLTVASADGLFTPKVKFEENVEISSASAAGYGGISISTHVYLSTGTFYGDGSGLTGVISLDETKVYKAGDTMTGQLTIDGSTLTVGGNAFSVGGSTLSVYAGKVSVGGAAYTHALNVSGNIYSDADVMAQGEVSADSVRATAGGSFYGVTAASATFWSINSGNYTVDVGSGILVRDGVVTAPYFVGDGTMLSGVMKSTDTSLVSRAGDTMSGNLEIQGSSLTVSSYGTHKYALTVASAAQANAYSLSVTTAGYVGIGNADPAAPLHVNERIYISNPELPGKANMEIRSYQDYSYIAWSDNALTASGGAAQGVLGFAPGSPGNRILIYRAMGTDPYNGGEEVFRIRSTDSADWKFGIGTDTFLKATPREKFHVMVNTLVSSGTAGAIPVLHVDTGTMNVMISTTSSEHTLTVGGGIISASSVTAQGGFFGDGSGLTNLQTASLPGVLDVSTITSRAGSLYDAVVFSTAVYVQSKLMVGEVMIPQASVHVRGPIRIDSENGAGNSVLEFHQEFGGNSYLYWNEGATPQQGLLGIKSGERDLVYRAAAAAFTGATSGIQAFRIKDDASFIVGEADLSFEPFSKFHVLHNLTVGGQGKIPALFVSTGNSYVGISTGVPQEGLHVVPSMLVGADRAAAALYVSTQTGYVGVATGYPTEGLHSAASFLVGGDVSTAKFYVSTGTGYTGVGTGDPQARLHVAGYSYFVSSAVVDGTGITGSAPVLNVKSDSLLVRGDGRVGIGNGTPQAMLDVAGGAIFSSSVTVTGSGLSGTQSAMEVIGSTFIVRNDGTVGIGVASPAERLDVDGKVKATGFAASRERIPNTCAGAATCTATCTAGKQVMGGGCVNTQSAETLYGSFPASDSSWQCDYAGGTGDITAYAICSTVE